MEFHRRFSGEKPWDFFLDGNSPYFAPLFYPFGHFAGKMNRVCRYHQIKRKAKLKDETKKLELMEKTDHEAYLEKLKDIDKMRMTVFIWK